MAELMTEDPEEEAPSLLDTRSLIRAQLATLRSDAEEGAGRAEDRLTEAHLQDVSARIDRILERRAEGR